MAGEPIVTVVGNVTGEVDLRYSAKGNAVARFTVASTPRSKNQQTGQWDDGETLWLRCTAFRSDAENAAESLQKGTRVVVTGRLSQETWKDKSGQDRTSLRMVTDEIGVSIKWATVTSKRADREGGNARPKPVEDPWALKADEPPPF